MPATEGGGGAAVVLGCLLRAVVRILDSVSVAWAAKCLRAESVGHGGAHVVDHFLRYHLGVYGAPVPLVLERLAEPIYAVEDYCLHFHASRAVGVPDGFNPKVNVDVLTVFVDVGIAGDRGRGELEVIGWGAFPTFRERFGPSRNKEVHGYGVFE